MMKKWIQVGSVVCASSPFDGGAILKLACQEARHDRMIEGDRLLKLGRGWEPVRKLTAAEKLDAAAAMTAFWS